MEFVEIKKTPYLSVGQMNAINDNFLYLRQQILDMGYHINNVGDSSVTYSIAPINIIKKFDIVEQNIQLIHESIIEIFGETEKYYKEFIWSYTTPNRKAEVWRWIDWMNEVKELVGVYEPLYDSNNEQVFDVNNERILVLREREQ